MQSLTEIKKDKMALLQALGISEEHRDLAHAPCKFCGSSDALSVSAKEGVWLFCCHSCRKAGSILDAGVTIDRPATKQSTVKQPKVFISLDAAVAAFAKYFKADKSTVWKYYDATGGIVLMAVGRFDIQGKKRYSPFSPVAGGWICRDPQGPLPLYNLQELFADTSRKVWVVEGEKCADAVRLAGGLATTSAHGSNAADKTDWTPLAGRSVIIWPDADKPGADYADKVKQILFADEKTKVNMIDLEMLRIKYLVEDGQDAADLLTEDKAEQVFEDVASCAVEIRRPSVLDRLRSNLGDAITGRRYCAGLPWPQLSVMTRPVTPETVTMLVGSPGSVKSLMLLECIRYWVEQGHKVAALMLEDSAAFHHRRLLAQFAENSDLTDDAFCKENPHAVNSAMKLYEAVLSPVASAVETLSNETPPTAQNLAAWVEAKAEQGCRVICIDPITMMTKTNRPWDDDQLFTARAKKAIEKHGASLFLVSHPRRQPPGMKNQINLDDLAGGVCYSRFTQNAFLLTKVKPEEYIIKTQAGVFREHCNRKITCLKNRSGKGESKIIMIHFSGKTLLATEHGEEAE